MDLKVKKLHPEAVTPLPHSGGNAGIDLTAIAVNITDKYVEYDTGLALEIPEGHVGLIYPRSSVTNKDLMLKNSTGVIDSSYRGPVKFRFLRTKDDNSDIYKIGERIGQLIIMPYPQVTSITVVDELSSTERGSGGYGSTGV